jgi:signal transduction histidine kinase
VVPAGGWPTWWSVLVSLAASVPLLWRRSFPIRTGAVVGWAIVVLALAKVPPLLPVGGLVSLYTVALLSPPRARWLGVVATVASIGVSVVIPGEDLSVARYLGVAYVAAYALGISARARAAQADLLRAQAGRLEQERAAAAIRERTRIARDIHDIVTNSVGIMVVQAEAGPLAVRSDPDRAEAVFDAIADTGRSAVGQLRRALGALRSGDEPAARQPQPGIGAIGGLIEQTRQVGLTVSIEVRGQSRPVPADVDLAAYRIVQEALTNVVRHAAADSVDVCLRWSDGTLMVEIADDGRGVSTAPGSGFGLVGMRERVLACGGTLDTGPGKAGFLVAATLPIG